MTEAWLPAFEVRRPAEGWLEAEWQVEAGAPWFDGHFPGRPILPGLGLLAGVVGLVRAGQGRAELALAEVKRCRFRALVEPGDRLGLRAELQPGPAGLAVRFELRRGDEDIGSGQLRLVAPEERAG